MGRDGGDRWATGLACLLALSGCGGSGGQPRDGGADASRGGTGGGAGRTGTGGAAGSAGSTGAGGFAGGRGGAAGGGAAGSGGAVSPPPKGTGGAGGSMGGAGGLACDPLTTCAGKMSGPWCVDQFLPGDTMAPSFTGVWSDGPTDVWAVGTRQSSTSSSENGFVFHWNGCAWASVPIASTAGFNDVWGTSTHDIWIVGSGGTSLHWNGATWSSVTTGTTDNLTNVSGSGSNDVWAIGISGVIHWNGTAWAPSPGGTTAAPMNTGFIGDIWAAAPNDVWVAQGSNLRGSASHFDGTSWTTMMVVPNNQFQVFGIWAGGGIAWAVGEGSDTYLFSGGAWAEIGPGGGSAEGLLNVMAIGNDIWASGQTIVHSPDGAVFTRDDDAPSGFYTGLWMTSAQVWIGGNDFDSSGELGAVVLHRAR
jgi:hypothetical protein